MMRLEARLPLESVARSFVHTLTTVVVKRVTSSTSQGALPPKLVSDSTLDTWIPVHFGLEAERASEPEVRDNI
jgi:hypothetical protein